MILKYTLLCIIFVRLKTLFYNLSASVLKISALKSLVPETAWRRQYSILISIPAIRRESRIHGVTERHSCKHLEAFFDNSSPYKKHKSCILQGGFIVQGGEITNS